MKDFLTWVTATHRNEQPAKIIRPLKRQSRRGHSRESEESRGSSLSEIDVLHNTPENTGFEFLEILHTVKD